MRNEKEDEDIPFRVSLAHLYTYFEFTLMTHQPQPLMIIFSYSGFYIPFCLLEFS